MLFTAEDTHSPCVVCLRARRVSSQGSPLCKRLSLCMLALRLLYLRREPSPAFLAVPALRSPRRSGGSVGSRGNHGWSGGGYEYGRVPIFFLSHQEKKLPSYPKEVDVKDVDKLCKAALFTQAYYERGGWSCFFLLYGLAAPVLLQRNAEVMRALCNSRSFHESALLGRCLLVEGGFADRHSRWIVFG